MSLIIVAFVALTAATTTVAIRVFSPPISPPPRTEAPRALSPPIFTPQRTEALRALKGLRSATHTSLTYRDYAPRVTETKIVLDRYLEEPERGDGQARAAMREAFDLYALAVSAWRIGLTVKTQPGVAAHEARGLASDSRVVHCPALYAAVTAPNDPKAPYTDIPVPIQRGLIIASNVAMIWSCAADLVDEAERLGR